PVRLRLEHLERFDVGLLLRRIGPSGLEGHLDVEAGGPGRLLDGGTPAEDDQVGKRDLLLTAGRRVVERRPDALEDAEHLRELRGIVDRPILLWREANARAVGSATLVRAAERRRGRPGG